MEQKGTYITLDRIVTIRSNNLDKSIKTKKILEESLIKKGFKPINYLHEKTELIISIGGDGSFLTAVNQFNFSNKPSFLIFSTM